MASRVFNLVSAGLALTTLLHPANVLAADLELTEAELRAYDGTDSEKPIYLAIDGTIFDVSAAPAFYGPGGHYHHFTGRDATRAWVTECWDTEDQLTWRMDGIEAMFMPKWLDELIESAGKDGDEASEAAGVMGKEAIAKLVEKAAQKFGKVKEEEKQKRRVEDQKEAAEGVKKALDHWYKFFAENPKYSAVGKVILDKENTPAPPAPCAKAMQKRPLRGGLIDKAGAGIGGMMGGAAQQAKGSAGKGTENMPDFLRSLKDRQKERDGKKSEPVEDDDEDLVKDEL